MTTVYPGLDLDPSTTLFPGTPIPVIVDGFAQPIEVSLGDLVLTATDSSGVVWSAGTMTGWWGSTPASMQPTAKTRAPGSWADSSTLQSRIITVSGVASAGSIGGLRDAMDTLNGAASLGPSLFTVSEGGLTRSCIVYRQDEVAWGRITQTDASWSIQMQALDPRKFGAAVSASTALPSVSGGLTFPVTFPFSFNTTIVSGQLQLINPGNAAGPVSLRVDGPIDSFQIDHTDAAGDVATFAMVGYTLNAGGFVTINPTPDGQWVLEQGEASRNAYITSRDWHWFTPGLNTWSFSAVGGSGLLTVTATPAWL